MMTVVLSPEYRHGIQEIFSYLFEIILEAFDLDIDTTKT